MVFYATFNNISVIVWQSFLLVEETGVSGENHRLPQVTDKFLCFFPCPIICLHVLSSMLWNRYDFHVKTMFCSSLPDIDLRGLMSYLRYLCLCAHSGVQHILCCAFVLYVFVLCTLCCKFICIVHFWFPNRYSLKLMYTTTISTHINLHHMDNNFRDLNPLHSYILHLLIKRLE